MNNTCRFCQLREERILDSDPLVTTLLDRFPVSPGHSLIIPVRHVESFFDTTSEERQAILQALDRAKSRIDKEHSPASYNIGINDGPAAGQTVMHLHVHLIPRYKGDTADPRGGVRWILPDKAKYWID